MDPGKDMTNKNSLTDDSEHFSGLNLGTTIALFSLYYEAKLINFDNDTHLKLSKPIKAQYHSKFIDRRAIIPRKYN